MKELWIEVIGTEPPCDLAKKNVEKAASKLREIGVKVNVVKLDITSKETVLKTSDCCLSRFF